MSAVENGEEWAENRVSGSRAVSGTQTRKSS